MSEWIEILDEPDEPSKYGEEPVAWATSQQATTSMRRLHYYQTLLAEQERPFDEEIARLQEWKAQVTRKAQERIEWHTMAIEAYHRAGLAAGECQPTLNLPTGSSLLKARRPKIEVTDEAELLAWAEGEGIDLLPNVPTPKVMAGKLNAAITVVGKDTAEPGEMLKVAAKGTGESVPGVTAVAQEPSFSLTEGKR